MATERSDAALFFNEVFASEDGRAAFGGHFFIYEGTEDEVTRVTVWSGEDRWARVGDVDAIVPSLCTLARAGGKLALAALGRDGTFVLFEGTNRLEMTIPIDPGFLFQVCQVAGNLYACGSQRQVWRFDRNAWRRFDEGFVVPRSRRDNPVLYSIHGVAKDAIYTVGRGGDIGMFDGAAWRLLDSPTNQSLERVLCVSEDEVYICGNSGLLFRGSEDTWESIGPEGYDQNLWGLARFQNRTYVCSNADIFVSDGVSTTRVETGLGPDAVFNRLSANAKYLWATSGKDVLYRFDGTEWTTQIWPDNR
jgi:hypothetical protein